MFDVESLILVVDDEQTMRMLVKAELRKMGFKNFLDAENGAEALKVLMAQYDAHKPVHFVLADWTMPLMTGIDFLKKARTLPEFQNLPIMLITSEGQQAQVVGAIHAGVSNYLVKPFAPAQLRKKILEMWEKYNPRRSAKTG